MQDDKLSEQVFDSLVEELVTGQHPPDLSARILAAWQQEQNVSRTMPRSVVRSKPMVTTGSAAARYKFAWIAAVAAGLLLGVVGWKWGSTPSDVQQQTAKQDNTAGASGKVDAKPTSDSLAQQANGIDAPALAKAPKEPTANQTPQSEPPRRKATETINAPFELDSNLAINSKVDSAAPTSSSVKLTASDIIAELDRRMSELWSSVEVTPAPTASPTNLAQRISLELTGQQIVESQLNQLIDSKKQQLDKATLISSAIDSMAFERWWSQRIVQLWLGRSTQGDAESALVEALASRMNGQKQWNVVVAELIGGELGEDSLSSHFLSLLGGGENHQLVECIGKNFLNEQVACMRCHRRPDAENIPTNQQAAYWSLVALLKGVEAHGPGEPIVDRQRELFANADADPSQVGVYFELPNGVLKQAFAQLPNGDDWRKVAAAAPRESLAKWIADSNDLDRAAVNTTWQLIFGRPLVPLVPAVDAVGLEHRQQILDFLAQQFDSADHDLGQLVGWIVSSRSFAAQQTDISRDQWQAASEQQLESQQLADLVFATGVQSSTAPTRERLQDNLNFVVQWRSGSKPNTLLAQPAQLEPGANAVQPKKSETQYNSDFVVHGLRHTAAQQAYIDRLLRADKLTWSERVQHVVGLSSLGLANDDVQYAAKELLQQHSGNTKSALLDLLWAVQATQL